MTPATTAHTKLAIVGAFAVVLVLTFSMNGLAPVLPAIFGGAFLFAVLAKLNNSWIVHAMLVVLFATSVPEIPRGLRVGGIFIYFNEFFIFGALIYAFWLYRQNPGVKMSLQKSMGVRAAILFSAVIVMGLILAGLHGYPVWDIQYDVKSVIEMMMVVFIAAVIIATGDWQRYVKTITAVLIFSAALMVYASATGFELWGRTETAELYGAGGRVLAGGSDAVRYLTQTTPLALAVLLGSVALLLVGRISLVRVMPLLLPALVISVLSFSRNTLLALAGTLIFIFLIAVSNRNFVQLVLRLASVPLVAGIALFAFLGIGNAVGAHDWISTQTTGYANRVIAGFDQSNERADTSASYREQENEYIKKAGADHPLFGGGFGTHYKPPSGKRDTFPAFEGTLYAHNAYNWFFVKVGLMGVVAFVTLIVVCIAPALMRSRSGPLLWTAAATLAGLSMAIVVTPMPIEQPGSALLGIVMGICIAAGAPLSTQMVQGGAR